MNTLIYTRILLPMLIALAACVQTMNNAAAAEPATAAVRIVSIANPAQSIGIRIGDVLQRRIEIEADAPYRLTKNALPVKGTEHQGIELADIEVASKQDGQKTRYTLTLRYQVFAHTAAPGIMQLPAENIVLEGGTQAAQVHLPAWRFWFSPLVAGNIALAKAGLQPQLPPPLLATDRHRLLLGIFLACLLASVVGLVYANADRQWLPFMGGAFAQAYRKVKRLPADPRQEKRALLYLHEAFNRLHGSSLFARDLDRFFAQRPAFANMRADIEAFFARSNRQLFGNEHPAGDSLRELAAFARRLRDCERGIR